MTHLMGEKDHHQATLFEAVPEGAIDKEAIPKTESATGPTEEQQALVVPAPAARSEIITADCGHRAPATAKKSQNHDKKLRRQHQQKEKNAARQLEYREATGRRLIELSPEIIEVADSLLKIITSRFIGLFEIDLPILTKEGAKRVADLLRVHIVKRKKKFICVGGYFALRVLWGLKEPPKTIIAELHDSATDDDIQKWVLVEFQCIPLIFWLKKRGERSLQEKTASDGYEDCPGLFQDPKPRRRRTAQDDEFFKRFLETCESETGKQLINKPANEEALAKTLRLSKRTITNRTRNTR